MGSFCRLLLRSFVRSFVLVRCGGGGDDSCTQQNTSTAKYAAQHRNGLLDASMAAYLSRAWQNDASCRSAMNAFYPRVFICSVVLRVCLRRNVVAGRGQSRCSRGARDDVVCVERARRGPLDSAGPGEVRRGREAAGRQAWHRPRHEFFSSPASPPTPTPASRSSCRRRVSQVGRLNNELVVSYTTGMFVLRTTAPLLRTGSRCAA